MQKKIGNSTGVIISKTLLEGCEIGDEIEVNKIEDMVLLNPLKRRPRQGWDKAFKTAMKKGDIPEGDLFEGMENNFDKDEW